MDMPSAVMARNFRSHFDQMLDQPVNGPLHIFAPDVELANHMQVVESQNPHFQSGLVGF